MIDLTNTKPDGTHYFLNRRLLEQKEVSDSDASEIMGLHKIKNAIFFVAQNVDNTDLLKSLADEVTKIEFEMQHLWGFSIDQTFHEWYMFPKCTCPKMDNSDMRGTKYQSINLECIIHGRG